MHEMSLALALVEELETIASQEHAKRIISVQVTIGELSGVEQEAFELCFPFAAEGQLLGKARLDIRKVPAVIECNSCRKQSSPSIPFIFCGECSSTDVKIIEGREFIISSVELENV